MSSDWYTGGGGGGGSDVNGRHVEMVVSGDKWFEKLLGSPEIKLYVSYITCTGIFVN